MSASASVMVVLVVVMVVAAAAVTVFMVMFMIVMMFAAVAAFVVFVFFCHNISLLNMFCCTVYNCFYVVVCKGINHAFSLPSVFDKVVLF